MARKLTKAEEQRLLAEEKIEQIRGDLDRHRPGLWAEEVAYGPACHCGLRSTQLPCERHPHEV